MGEQKFYSPLKIGFLIVALAYFLFTLHGNLTLEWVGEWDRITTPGSTLSTIIFWEDVLAAGGLAFRLVASIAALSGVILYLYRKSLPTQTTRKFVRVILAGEAVYWLSLLPSAVLPLILMGNYVSFTSLVTNDIPLLVESIAIPLALFKLVYELNPNKPLKGAIKWGWISGVAFILTFWLTNSGLWLSTISIKGVEYLTNYPENLLSFDVTRAGMFALLAFTVYFAAKSKGTETLEKLKLKQIGLVVTALGLFFLWNYLTWIFFGRDETWSWWYAWFLGHNLDLWMLSLPLVGLPLLFEKETSD